MNQFIDISSGPGQILRDISEIVTKLDSFHLSFELYWQSRGKESVHPESEEQPPSAAIQPAKKGTNTMNDQDSKSERTANEVSPIHTELPSNVEPLDQEPTDPDFVEGEPESESYRPNTTDPRIQLLEWTKSNAANMNLPPHTREFWARIAEEEQSNMERRAFAAANDAEMEREHRAKLTAETGIDFMTPRDPIEARKFDHIPRFPPEYIRRIERELLNGINRNPPATPPK